ncbi:MAG: DUF4301 family protein [Reichenbachiella sp.]|uniref:DUF4301 family protein n=1 Tax=Reichenbachiella sp. TaxID=2184521 RepID=UPI0032645085
MFTAEQKEFIQSRGSDIKTVERQMADFKVGFPYLNLARPATIGDGIIQLSEQQVTAYSSEYESLVSNKELLKFVPASGAATRMFKELFEFLDTNEINSGVEKFIDGLENFAFYTELTECLINQGTPITELLEARNYKPIVHTLLDSSGLNYGSLPKGLLLFHIEEDIAKTPLEEHLTEGAKYAVQKDGRAKLHFTVSPEHQEKFEEKLAGIKAIYEKKFGIQYEVTFSQQKKSTDTIAVDLADEPFMENGKLLFRPAGHGALLENLNDLDADVIFVKNIDNVVPDHLKTDTLTYKKALASLLLEFQQDSFDWQMRASAGEDCMDEALVKLKSKYSLTPELTGDKALTNFLNRPVRVCGMVENTGEPGGGPFWVDDESGLSLQIAETAQIDLDKTDQAEILKGSSHFNPVDLVCGVRDYKGKKFDLLQYRNDKTGFITQKSRSGKDLKAMELPGLWNGAMANWITIFVEVPISTFNPVKTVNDLLKSNHQ